MGEQTKTQKAKEVEETIEGMLLRLEEFCSLTDMIRSDTSQILEENIPLLKAKVTEMRSVYAKVDQLERKENVKIGVLVLAWVAQPSSPALPFAVSPLALPEGLLCALRGERRQPGALFPQEGPGHRALSWPSSRWLGTTSPSWRPTCCRPSGTTHPSHRLCGDGWAPPASLPSGRLGGPGLPAATCSGKGIPASRGESFRNPSRAVSGAGGAGECVHAPVCAPAPRALAGGTF
uniref:Breast carcinoma amplified sequence 4 n=1 Tax=Suricata suricatta TaxID=37032 RepID=A0A673U6Y9_SURSU